MDYILDTDRAVQLVSKEEGTVHLTLFNNSGNTAYLEKDDERATADLGIPFPSSAAPYIIGLFEGDLLARASVAGTRVKLLKSFRVIIPEKELTRT